MAATRSIYKVWKDSVPVLPFPFDHNDKVEGRITHTWTDVKEGLNRDAINMSLAFATGHFTPTSPQSEIMRETMLKEEKRRRRELRAQSSMDGTVSTMTGTTTDGRPMTQATMVSEGGQTTATAQTNATATTSKSSRRLRGEIANAQEMEALLNSEGGGRGRKAYLKLRQQRSVQQRFGERPPTTSTMYGWDCTPQSLARISSKKPADESGKDGRKKGASSWMRSRGIFSSPEFVAPVQRIE